MSNLWQTFLEQIPLITIVGIILQTLFLYKLNNKTKKLELELSFKNQHKLNWKAAEREALIDFNSSISDQIRKYARFKINKYNIDNYMELQDVYTTLKRINIGVTLAQNHLNLFVSDDEMLTSIKVLRDSIKDFRRTLVRATELIYEAYNDCSKKIIENPAQRDIFISQTEEDIGMPISSEFYQLYGKFSWIDENHKNLIAIMRDRIKRINED